MMSFAFLNLTAISLWGLNTLFALTVLCVVVLFTARCVFRHDPALRYAVCFIGLLCTLLSPLIVALPSQRTYSLFQFPLPQTFPQVGSIVPGSTGIGAATAPQDGSWWMGFVLSLWIAGIMWGVLRFAYGYRQVARLAKEAHSWESPDRTSILDWVANVLDCPAPPVLISSRLASPVAIGLLRPAVILPERLAEMLAPSVLRQVLLHECAHVAFRHAIGGLAARVATMLFWPYPPIYALCREMARAREEICDNVASQEGGVACYARTLLALAQGIQAAPNPTSTLALMGPGFSLEERIAGLLNPRRNRMVRVQRWKLWAVTGMVGCTLASTAVVRVVAETKAKQEAAKTTDSATAAKLEAEAEAREAEAEAGAKRGQPVKVFKVKPDQFVFVVNGKKVGPLHLRVIPDNRSTGTDSEAAEIAAKKMAEAKAHGAVLAGQRIKPDVAKASTAESAAKQKAEAEAKAK